MRVSEFKILVYETAIFSCAQAFYLTEGSDMGVFFNARLATFLGTEIMANLAPPQLQSAVTFTFGVAEADATLRDCCQQDARVQIHIPHFYTHKKKDFLANKQIR